MKTEVVNIRKSVCDVYIGRGTEKNPEGGYFGNPFDVQAFGREQCLIIYRAYFYFRLSTDPEFRRRVHELEGKVLGCFCKPNTCHGDVIIEYLENKPNTD